MGRTRWRSVRTIQGVFYLQSDVSFHELSLNLTLCNPHEYLLFSSACFYETSQFSTSLFAELLHQISSKSDDKRGKYG